jgi:hypothetical protein
MAAFTGYTFATVIVLRATHVARFTGRARTHVFAANLHRLRHAKGLPQEALAYDHLFGFLRRALSCATESSSMKMTVGPSKLFVSGD